MILFWFILGIVAITLISRYNENNGLFWKLFIAFMLGFVSCKVYIHLTNQDKKNLTEQVYPTQDSENLPKIAQFFLAGNGSEIAIDFNQALVSKEITPATDEVFQVLNKVFGRVRDRPQLNVITCNWIKHTSFYDTS